MGGVTADAAPPRLPYTTVLTDADGTPLALGLEHAADLSRPTSNSDTARSAETRRLDAADWKAFVSWCRQHGQGAVLADPAFIAAYLTSLAATPSRVLWVVALLPSPIGIGGRAMRHRLRILRCAPCFVQRA